MNDKVFVICPECMLELPLRRTVGDDIGVVTVLGNVLNEHSTRDVLGTIDVLRLESPVNELHFVFEPNCKATDAAQLDSGDGEFSIEKASKRNRELIVGSGSDDFRIFFWQVASRDEAGTLDLEPVSIVD